MRSDHFVRAGLLALMCLIVVTPRPVTGADGGAARPGQTIAAVTFHAPAGKPQTLHALAGSKATVVVFLSFDCPVSNSYAPLLAGLHQAYAGRGVAFLGVCAGEEGAAQVTKLARDFGLPFPVFKDEAEAACHAFRAEATPEAFVLDHRLVLRYRGRLDDAYSARLKKNPRVTREDLRLALDEVLAGRPVTTPVTAPVGCPTPGATAGRRPTGRVTFYRDVLPVLQRHCQVCHRPGQVGPFPLLTYRQAARWADDLKEYTRSRKMPPWKPVDGPGFRDERGLTEREIDTLAAWADGGAPEGDLNDAPAPRRFPGDWQLGPPDLVLTMPADFRLGARGEDLYRCFVLPTDLPEDRFITAVEVRPGNARVVHHAILLYDTSGQARRFEEQERQRPKADTEADHGPGYNAWMGIGFMPRNVLTEPSPFVGGWAPGQVPYQVPAGTGLPLPRGADVVLQLHYHRNGRVETDRTRVGLYFAKGPVARQMQGFAVPAGFLYIPAGADRYRVRGRLRVEQDCVLHAVMPHMHLLGREITVRMRPPDGPAQVLVAIKDWDYGWQETYFFRRPIPVAAGTRFDVEAVYDNSAANPNNPHRPPRLVLPGLRTNDEMCLAFLGATADRPGRIRWRFELPPRDDKQD